MRVTGDCHIHMALDGVNFRDAVAAHRDGPRDDIIRPRLKAYSARGITFLRDGGDAFGVGERARALAPEYGIDYRSPAFPICRKGRYGGFIGRTFETTAEYRALVAEVGRRGGDFIKLMLAGLMDFDRYGVVTGQPLDRGDIAEMVRVAHGEGYAVMAHVNGAEAVIRALDAGVDSIEHGGYMTPEALRAMAQSDAVWVPTLCAVGNLLGDGRYPDTEVRRILAGQLESVAACARMGGRIALGSDAGAHRVFHAQGAQDEYGLLCRALDQGADAALIEGERFIRERFARGG